MAAIDALERSSISPFPNRNGTRRTRPLVQPSRRMSLRCAVRMAISEQQRLRLNNINGRWRIFALASATNGICHLHWSHTQSDWSHILYMWVILPTLYRSCLPISRHQLQCDPPVSPRPHIPVHLSYRNRASLTGSLSPISSHSGNLSE